MNPIASSNRGSPCDAIRRYLDRHAENFPEDLPPPSERLGVCVVIPALAERGGIGSVIESLDRDLHDPGGIEVIVVVNHAENATAEVIADNRATVALLDGLSTTFPLHVLQRVYPPGTAGVGAARRTGMDLALRRLVAAGRTEGTAIACLDADSPVAPGYVDALSKAFGVADPPWLVVCGYRHPLPGDEDAARSIVAYELWLRYLEHAVMLAGSPYAFQTVGSTLVASPRGYALCDGMPRRQAGEDFYFVQKMVKAGGPERVVRLAGAMVFPSFRISHRVPFGTGRAMRRCREEGPGAYLRVEPPSAYLDLRSFFGATGEELSKPGRLREACAPLLDEFIASQDGWRTIERLRKNSREAKQFHRAVHTWFDSLRIVRYARVCKSNRGGAPILDALRRVLDGLGQASRLAGLPDAGETGADLTGLIGWLERLREPVKKPCAGTLPEGKNSP